MLNLRILYLLAMHIVAKVKIRRDFLSEEKL